MSYKKVERVKTITEYQRSRGLPKPEHPLISLIDYETIKHAPENNTTNWVLDFYSISLKRNFDAKIKYGQSEYDFDEGVMFFISPGQVFSIEVQKNPNPKRSGWTLLIHPDFLWNSSLSKTIKHYDYFDYSSNEALFLSDKEEKTVVEILKNIRHEYQSNIDSYSQHLIIAQLELLFTYAERFYHRQFITRKIPNHKILNQLEDALADYFASESLSKAGMPSVHYIAEKLNISPNYLSNLLKVLTGQSTQQHIHDKLIEKAKEKLSTTDLSVGEIAYSLGFEHTQSFSRLFKLKSKVSPQEFRSGFN
ncbi:AraC family transcriptional regulator [Sphingobacteriaceae bacterium]|nr:AraC family transcriptional regulator [Sphingobacteriaceae bacterium]